MITVTALMTAKEGSADDLARVIKKFEPKFRQAPGCKTYKVVKRLDAPPDLFFFYEQYENPEAVANHTSAPLFQEMTDAMAPYLDGEPEIYLFTDI
ncbi:MAG: putative quinol monooxygenase [Dehalococcoidia bacterium]